MFRSILGASLILFNSVVSGQAANYDNGQYFFRYNTSSVQENDDSSETSKDITAFFAGGVGIAFSQKIPMRPEWENDNWVLTSGTLPAGISFDSSTETFSGKPTAVVSNREVELVGYDKSGSEVATASVTFDIFQLPIGATFPVDLYAHTGKYSFNQLAVPAGITVDKWTVLDAPPPGVNIIGRNLDGTPTKPGTYRLLIQGLDFLGKPVVAFVGTFTVEDAPVFPLVADKLINIDLQYQPSVRVDFATTKVKRAIGKPRYYVEVEGDNPLPGNLYITNDVFNPHVTGYIFKNYDQATLRYKAVDSDETVAYSNWFKVGTLGPAPNCGTYTTNPVPMDLDGYVGTAFPPYYIPTTNSAGSRTYTLVDGQLPKGLSLDAASGIFSGTPQQEETREGIAVRIDVSNNGNVDSTTCGPYTFRINPARFDLSASVSPKDFHVGGAVTGVLKTSGGILPGWSVAVDSASALPSGVTFDKNALSFSGTVNVAGTYQPTFTLTNGDGRQAKAATTFIARNQLALGDPALKSVAQFELLDDLASANVDVDTVVGAAKMTVEGGSLPPGMSFAFDGVKGSISGGTKLSPQSFGPYTFKVTDDEGQIANSAPFYLQVTDRKDLEASQPVSPNFTIKKFSSLKPVTVALPPLGDSLVLSYTLNGPALPEGLTFDKDTGTISGTPSAKITLTNYTITVTDGQKSVTSAPFSVTVGDPATIPPIILGSITKNVTGQVVSFITTPAPDLSTVADFMVGDVKDAKFTSIAPSVPGLFPDLSNGTLSGNPTTPFDGDVSIKFEDSAGREGKAVVHLIILPYPSISVDQASYSLSRLADASKIGFNLSPNNGFIGSIQYSLARGSNPLPPGITLTSQGALADSTTVNPQTFGGIIVNAKDLSTGIEVQSGAFAIKIEEETGLTLALPQKQLTYRLFNGTFAISSADVFNPAPAPTGSRVQPLKWSIDDDGGSGLSISSTTGQLTGTPGRLGSWPITIRVTDSDTPPSSATDNVTVKASLQGWVVTEPGGQAIGPLRVGESFTTLAQTPSNYVGNPVYSDLSSTGLSLNPSTGQFSGSFDAPGTPTWKLQVTDNDGRTLQNPATFSAAIVGPLQLDQSGTPSTVISKQFDSAARVTMQFKPATQSLGRVSYAISDNLPGTLVYKFYPNDDLSAKPVFFHYDAQGSAMELAADALPDDAFVFDTVNLTLTGVPSASGSFGQIFLYASDDHQDNYQSPNDPTRAFNNTAAAGPFTINVAAADGLVASNNLSSEVIYQYTSQPTIRSTVLNGAYGKPIKFERKAGTLPTNVTANGSGNILTYQGYSTAIGTQTGIIYQATDAVGRSIDLPAVSIETKAREPLVLEASSNPKGMVVFEDDANLTVSAKNVPFGGSIASDKWTLSGLSNLPAGVTSKIENGHVSFSGTASIIGTYKDIIVSAVDSLGGSASVNLTFKVISSSDPIEVNVSNITTKVGMPVKMEPPFAAAPISTGNTYGTIRFSSADIATLFPGVTLDSSTGSLSGSLSSIQENTFNLKVNDGTNRLTSKSVKISVIPNLRIVAPTLITTTQGADANVAVDTSFNIGTVSYVSKGTWPAGLSVNPATGAIKGSATASTGTYPGLTIEGVDASGDRQSSNVFSIKVDPIDALPIIANVPLNKWPFGTVGTPIQSFTSAVTDNVKGKAWPGPLTFTLNHDIADTGLTFDSKLGMISGTATKPFLYKDLVVTVKTERGDTASTAPFWFGVQPKDAIVIAAGQKSHYTVRVGSGYSTDPLIFLNTFGNVTFTNVQALVKPINPTNGVYAEASVTASSMSGQPQGGWPEDAVVTDEFGRTGTFRTSLEVAPAITLTPPATVSFEIAAPSKTSDKPVVAGVVGTPTWSTQGMPSWLTFNADGSFTGSAPTGTSVGDVSFSVTVTDPSDGVSKTVTYTAKVYTIKSYRVVLDAWIAHPTIAACVGMSEFYVMNGTSDITSLSGVVPSSSDKDYPAKNLTDGVVSTASMWFITDGSAQKWIGFNRIANNKATAIKWVTRADNFLPCNPTQWHIQMSPDDVNWTTIGTGSSSGAAGTYTTLIPQ